MLFGLIFIPIVAGHYCELLCEDTAFPSATPGCQLITVTRNVFATATFTDTVVSTITNTETQPTTTTITSTETVSVCPNVTDVPFPLPSGDQTSPIDLTNWKVTLPIPRLDSEKALEISQPDLETYRDEWFFVEGDALVFIAPVEGATTSGSGYPRSELREMINDGQDRASWSTLGTHILEGVISIDHTPVVKPDVSAIQIHDAGDDVFQIVIKGTVLVIRYLGRTVFTITREYVLGTRFRYKLVVENDVILFYYNNMDTPIWQQAHSGTGNYFKVGAYTQSNLSKGDSPGAYGEVRVYENSVSHVFV